MPRSRLLLSIKAATLIAGLLVAPGVAAAAPCVVDNLQSYTALGAGGCTIGSIQFDTFMLLPAVFPEIDPATVSLTPTAEPGFLVGLNRTAPAGQTLQSTFSFMASGAPFSIGRVGLIGSLVNFDGANTGSAQFSPGGTAIAFDIGLDAQLTDSIALPMPVSVLTALDFVIDGGGNGNASLQQGMVAFTVVPEPSGAVLSLITVAALAWNIRRRSHTD